MSKVWTTDQGTEKATKAINDILKRLDTDYLDLLLIHWPYGDQYDKSDPKQAQIRLETWKVMQKFRDEGKTKDIGVSNFLTRHLEKLILDSGQKPVVNQIEISPLLWQEDPIDFCQKHNIAVAGYSILARNHDAISKNETLNSIAKKHNKSWAQVVVRWLTQKDIIAIVKAKSPQNLKANLNIFDFELSFEDFDQIKKLQRGMRICEDPRDVKY